MFYRSKHQSVSSISSQFVFLDGFGITKAEENWKKRERKKANSKAW